MHACMHILRACVYVCMHACMHIFLACALCVHAHLGAFSLLSTPFSRQYVGFLLLSKVEGPTGARAAARTVVNAAAAAAAAATAAARTAATPIAVAVAAGGAAAAAGDV